MAEETMNGIGESAVEAAKKVLMSDKSQTEEKDGSEKETKKSYGNIFSSILGFVGNIFKDYDFGKALLEWANQIDSTKSGSNPMAWLDENAAGLSQNLEYNGDGRDPKHLAYDQVVSGSYVDLGSMGHDKAVASIYDEIKAGQSDVVDRLSVAYLQPDGMTGKMDPNNLEELRALELKSMSQISEVARESSKYITTGYSPYVLGSDGNPVQETEMRIEMQESVVDGKTVVEPVLDENGNTIPVKDENGNIIYDPVFDDAGNPVYRTNFSEGEIDALATLENSARAGVQYSTEGSVYGFYDQLLAMDEKSNHELINADFLDQLSQLDYGPDVELMSFEEYVLNKGDSRYLNMSLGNSSYGYEDAGKALMNGNDLVRLNNDFTQDQMFEYTYDAMSDCAQTLYVSKDASAEEAEIGANGYMDMLHGLQTMDETALLENPEYRNDALKCAGHDKLMNAMVIQYYDMVYDQMQDNNIFTDDQLAELSEAHFDGVDISWEDYCDYRDMEVQLNADTSYETYREHYNAMSREQDINSQTVAMDNVEQTVAEADKVVAQRSSRELSEDEFGLLQGEFRDHNARVRSESNSVKPASVRALPEYFEAMVDALENKGMSNDGADRSMAD